LRRVQQVLKDRGFYSNSVDGTMGKGTQAAIIKFQQARTLVPSGLLDSPTLASMGLGGLGETNPPPTPKKSTPRPTNPSKPKSSGGLTPEERTRRAVGL
jgi:peptidoglycan hydrolase-like protein with peptidoglycan-binding domain